MFSLLKKELRGFFSSIIGYVVILVFITINSAIVWGLPFPGFPSWLLDNGYAELTPLFIWSPLVFLILVPAVTMRSFAEEKNTGTIELLFTRPISSLQIVLAKFFSGLILVLFSLLPTLVYFISVYQLGDPVGSIDVGATWGSYIGLFFLGAVYVAIGIFASSLTKSQIVAFLLSLILAALFFYGFDALGQITSLASLDYILVNLGIQEHYLSISRGVIDTRDVIYFISVVTVFVFLTHIVLESRKW
ncbi:MAG: gliding motility-associated ABC transporter permease subunit GldF [Marinilabiliales bacterium]|nr:MAG: gliding motility-associated ABC transporter permease subunit GldF [Marinilabiliales bacterium]